MSSVKVPYTATLSVCAYYVCDHIWENPPCSNIYEILVSYIFDNPRANSPASLRPITHLD